MLADAVPPHTVELDTTGVTGLRLYTRGPVSLPWLADHVVPVARTIAEGSGRIVYLRRGWLHGPHVDIIARRAFGPPPPWHSIAARLDAGPLDPATALTEEAYLAQAEEFGRLEGLPHPYGTLRTHGLVEFLWAAGMEEPAPAFNQLKDVVRSMLGRPLMRLVDELSAHPERATVRLAEAFVALADTHALGAAYGALSLRWHAEAFLAWAKPAGKVRTTFANRLAKEADQIRQVVADRLADAPSPAASGWRASLGYCAGALDNAAANGVLTPDLVDSVGPDGGPRRRLAGEPDNDFHRAVGESGVTESPSPFFASYSLLTNLFYQQLPLLTVSPLQRYYMCHAVAETIDDVLGEPWQERLRSQRWNLTPFAH
ncbi:hypothetical protein [Micromonospora arborensis]|uniref:hypothetical protein n=1 Tax=Micromonospora arborensis TaxID=2116518 RepID=UPI00371CA4CF